MCDQEGKPFDPRSLPVEQADEETPEPRRDAPIGRPMTPDEYARAKGEAIEAPDPAKPSAQEDTDD